MRQPTWRSNVQFFERQLMSIITERMGSPWIHNDAEIPWARTFRSQFTWQISKSLSTMFCSLFNCERITFSWHQLINCMSSDPSCYVEDKTPFTHSNACFQTCAMQVAQNFWEQKYPTQQARKGKSSRWRHSIVLTIQNIRGSV